MNAANAIACRAGVLGCCRVGPLGAVGTLRSCFAAHRPRRCVSLSCYTCEPVLLEMPECPAPGSGRG